MQTLIENINLLNPNSEVLTNYSVLIENKKIIEVSKGKIATKNKVNIVDGDDNYLLPGFIDSHVHLMANGFNKSDYVINPLALHFYSAICNGRDTIDAGVTYVRDCGQADLGVKIAQQRGLFVAPKMNISVTSMECTGGHFDLYLPSGFDICLTYPGLPHGRCDGVEGVTKKTREIKRAGADFIKVMASGSVLSENDSPNQAQFNKKELKAISREAKLANMRVSAHCHSLRGMNNCIKAGFNSIEHGTFINYEIAKRMVDKSIYLVPTLFVHTELLKNGFPSSDTFAREKIAKLKDIVSVHLENISDAFHMGVKILMGSDCGVISHGSNLSELKCLVDIGMSEMEAIASGTIDAAKYLRLDNEIGSIDVGKSADMILVSSNPLDNIGVLENKDNILKVFQDGKCVKG